MSEAKFNQLVLKVKRIDNQVDLAKLKEAFLFAQKAHLGQKRLSGADFIDHGLNTALILSDWLIDEDLLIAGLLHDAVEDGQVTSQQLEKKFGKTVTRLVMGVTKVRGLKFRGSNQEVFVENLRKLIVTMAKDLRVVLVRLADRWDNLQTLYVHSPEKQARKAKETLEVYAPLADRLGMTEIKSFLEDLSFIYLQPEEYQKTVDLAIKFLKKAEVDLKQTKRQLLSALAKKSVSAQISARTKGVYSLFNKLSREEVNWDLEKVHDLVALRVIVENIEDCYATLGIVHQLFKPVPSLGVSDFVAQPKPNGYQSIHAKVFALKRVIEVQIRTEEMHQEAEWGIAAHWHYVQKKGKEISDEKIERGFSVPDEKINWVRELVAWQKEVVDSKEFLSSLKLDALRKRIFIFSPQGDVYDLPLGATPVDFAYAVHSDLGNNCQGARVDGQWVSLDYQLKSGQAVEIIKAKKRKPSRDWLDFVVTKRARDKLKKITS